MSGSQNSAPVVLKRCGFRRHPPRILLHYTIDDDGKESLRQRSMPLRNLTKDSTAKLVAEDLVRRHKRYLEKMQSSQLEGIIQQLLDDIFPEPRTEEGKMEMRKEEDETVKRPQDTEMAEKIDTDKDKVETEKDSNKPGKDLEACVSSTQKGEQAAVDTVPKVYDNEEDLNKLSDKELAARKADMDKLFEANRKLPGDDGYEYDKSVDFGDDDAKVECGWDDDDDEDDEW